ncbi:MULTISPECIES: hypothetical protein [Streptomyces]|uniref:hypothetical protein n=1 Tax=Streptomyces TaxID=1883 RepID=UPI0036577014
MVSHFEIPDMADGLPTLEDFQRTHGESSAPASRGRPRQNPLATQETLRKFEAEQRRRARKRLNEARTIRKAEVDVFIEGVFREHPQIQALLISVVNHVFEYAQRGDKPLTDYDARTYVTQGIVREIRRLIGPEATIAFLKAMHGGPVEEDADIEAEPEPEPQPEPVTAMDEVPVTGDSKWDDAWEAGELPE